MPDQTEPGLGGRRKMRRGVHGPLIPASSHDALYLRTLVRNSTRTIRKVLLLAMVQCRDSPGTIGSDFEIEGKHAHLLCSTLELCERIAQ